LYLEATRVQLSNVKGVAPPQTPPVSAEPAETDSLAVEFSQYLLPDALLSSAGSSSIPLSLAVCYGNLSTVLHEWRQEARPESLQAADRAAESFARQAVQIRRRLLGERDPDTAFAMANLAALLESRSHASADSAEGDQSDRLSEALDLRTGVCTIYASVFGASHDRTRHADQLRLKLSMKMSLTPSGDDLMLAKLKRGKNTKSNPTSRMALMECAEPKRHLDDDRMAAKLAGGKRSKAKVRVIDDAPLHPVQPPVDELMRKLMAGRQSKKNHASNMALCECDDEPPMELAECDDEPAMYLGECPPMPAKEYVARDDEPMMALSECDYEPTMWLGECKHY
jgi:hypothetical protein